MMSLSSSLPNSMGVDILKTASISSSWSPDSLKSSEFRKATHNMKLSYEVFSQVFLPYEPLLRQHSIERMGLFIGTSHGELEPTIEFLKNLRPSRVANPIHFQNSLHNSILGFITQKFKLVSPGMTLSNSYFSAEVALQMAMNSIRKGDCDFAIALACDSIPKNCQDLFLSLYEGTRVPTKIKNGASAILLSSEKLSLAHSLKTMGSLKSVKCYYNEYKSLSLDESLTDYYDSNCLEKIASSLNEEVLGTRKLNLIKPDATYSEILFEKF